MGGVGVSEHHHGEILQGAVRRGGEVVPCLITMPTRRVGSRARYVPATEGAVDAGQGGEGASALDECVLEVVPAWKLKAARAAALALEFVGAPGGGGRLEIECSVATGVGLGSSTCDVVAAIRAVCAAYGVGVEPDVVARLAVAAEGAVDPIMFDREVVLFAQRQGRVLETLGSWIPPYVVVSIDTDAGTHGLDTLSLPPPQYTDAELDAFEELVARAQTAFERRDPAAVAAVATESAAMNQRFLTLRCFREIVALAGELGALGVQIAHSGTVAGILFDARSARARGTREPDRRYEPVRTDGPADPEWISEVMARVRSLGARPLGVFGTGADI